MSPSPALIEDLAALAPMKIDALRAAWRARFGDPPPALQSGDLLRRLFAERLQVAENGRDAELEARMDKLIRRHGRGQPVAAPRPVFSPGVRLTKEHGGVVHQVEVLEDGFRWNGREWKSLSQIARAITGVRWNGPRFFGLREEAPAKAVRR